MLITARKTIPIRQTGKLLKDPNCNHRSIHQKCLYPDPCTKQNPIASQSRSRCANCTPGNRKIPALHMPLTARDMMPISQAEGLLQRIAQPGPYSASSKALMETMACIATKHHSTTQHATTQLNSDESPAALTSAPTWDSLSSPEPCNSDRNSDRNSNRNSNRNSKDTIRRTRAGHVLSLTPLDLNPW